MDISVAQFWEIGINLWDLFLFNLNYVTFRFQPFLAVDEHCQLVHHFHPDSTMSPTIALTIGTDIHGAPMVNTKDFGGPVTFDLVLPAGQSFHLIQRNVSTDSAF